MSLEDYRKKRNFNKTKEPKGNLKDEDSKKLIFVVQEHWASHHHFDFRIEQEGVLKSWAIPKNPLLTSEGKRLLAVNVEDHPYVYKNFEGCFEFYTKIITENGAKNIGNVVNDQQKLNVLSYNATRDKLEWKPILNWFKNGQSRDFLKIRVPGQYGGRRVITVTPNHNVYTPEGTKEAQTLKVGDSILVPGLKWSQEQLQILLGTLLGDSHMELPEETQVPNFQLAHCGNQINYLKFMHEELAPNSKIRKRKNSDSYIFRFTHVSLVNLYPLFYVKKKKIINKEVLSKLDERGFAVWYMDDGYLSNGKFVELCTYGFTKEENKAIADYLNERWELRAKVYYAKPKKKSNGGYFIHLSRLGSMRFLTLVNDFILPELRYKTFIKKYNLKWKFEKGRNSIIPVKILSIEKATRKQIRSLQKYDIHVKDNNNYFAGSMLVSNSIPPGSYGAGTVKIWDKGTYELIEKTEKGFVIKINGNKLKGTYVLFKFKPPKNWLFFKKKED